MNTTSEIIVKTPVGKTSSFTVKNIVKQVTVLGPLLCSASTAECCVEHERGGMSIGSTSIRSLAYVDDIVDIDEDPDNASDAHKTVLTFTAKKRLELSWKKCALLVINSTKKTKIPNLFIDGKPVKREKSAKYLGDIINEKGSSSDLIEDRVKKGSVNIFALVQYLTFGCHTIETVLLLYNTLFISSVLYNAQSWSCLTNRDRKKLKVSHFWPLVPTLCGKVRFWRRRIKMQLIIRQLLTKTLKCLMELDFIFFICGKTLSCHASLSVRS